MSTVLFLTVACALTFSFVREIRKRGSDSFVVAVWKFFSFYTTLSNVLVLLWSAALAFVPSHATGTFAQNANVAAAITFYIVTVGIANYLIFGWPKLSFFERLSDLSVHAITPLATFLYWLFYSEKEQLQYALIGYWLIFPLSYAAYTMLHGKWSKFYPYEFTNVQELGLKKVSLNALALSISLVFGATLFVLLGKTVGRF
ncbi:MAG: Pr6Pr family membrane protein [Pseudomonadota bacterium]|nr:Pr6Pr family membrane protein [Pseudomonadota bacterium]|tara:strand:+ start:449 stop:1051 length:603 start_codon:yes stop_codon:yes gene_type:complete